ncbi:hypothetical protein ACLKA7_013904 [Drosophila subpalustris]
MTHARSMLNGALATPTRVTRWLGGGVSGVSVGTLTFLEQCAASETREEKEERPYPSLSLSLSLSSCGGASPDRHIMCNGLNEMQIE